MSERGGGGGASATEEHVNKGLSEFLHSDYLHYHGDIYPCPYPCRGRTLPTQRIFHTLGKLKIKVDFYEVLLLANT